LGVITISDFYWFSIFSNRFRSTIRVPGVLGVIDCFVVKILNV